MPWPAETNNTSTSVSTLLAQINAKQLAIRTLLNTVVTEKNSCSTNTAEPHAETGQGKHGQDGPDSMRVTAYTDLVSALASLTHAADWAQLSINQLSHEGGGTPVNKSPPPPPGRAKPSSSSGGPSGPSGAESYGGSTGRSTGGTPSGGKSAAAAAGNVSITSAKPSGSGAKPTRRSTEGADEKPSAKSAKRVR